MKTVSLSGAPRADVGKKDAKKHRKEGKIPCVLYGGKEQVHFVLDDLEFGKIIFTPEVFLINLDINGNIHQAILQDVQYHPVSDKVLHADFLEVVEGKQVTVSVPLKFTGVSPGVLAGGKLVQKMRKLTLKGLTTDIPDIVTIDISEMSIGSTIKVKDVKIDKLSLLDVPSNVVVSVKTARGAAEKTEEEQAAPAAE